MMCNWYDYILYYRASSQLGCEISFSAAVLFAVIGIILYTWIVDFAYILMDYVVQYKTFWHHPLHKKKFHFNTYVWFTSITYDYVK